MASTFKSAAVANVGIAGATLYTAPALTTTTVIGLSVCNVHTAGIDIKVTLVKGGTTAHLLKNVPLPYGSTIVAIGGDQKVVLAAGDYIQVFSDVATSLDAVVSVLELT
jgi:hypothetical protein